MPLFPEVQQTGAGAGAGLAEGQGEDKQPGVTICCVKSEVRYMMLELQREVKAKGINSEIISI